MISSKENSSCQTMFHSITERLTEAVDTANFYTTEIENTVNRISPLYKEPTKESKDLEPCNSIMNLFRIEVSKLNKLNSRLLELDKHLKNIV
jgi:hypothetical protein